MDIVTLLPFNDEIRNKKDLKASQINDLPQLKTLLKIEKDEFVDFV